MEPVALSPIKRRGQTLGPQLRDSASLPTFSSHFKARIDEVSTRRNEQAQKHTHIVRLGALKHHAKVLRHRENKEQERAAKRERARARDLNRAQRRRELEDVATRRHMEKVEDLVARDKLPAVAREADPNKVFVRYCPVAGFETVHKKLKPKTLKPLKPPGALPSERHVLHRDRMAEAALAEKCHGVRMSQRLFSHHAHITRFGERNLSESEVEAEHASHDDTVAVLDRGKHKVVVKDAVPRYKKKEYLDTANEFAVMRHMEKYTAAQHRTELREAARAREEAEASRAMDEMDRFAEDRRASERRARERAPADAGGSAWQRQPQNQLPTWAVDSTVYLGA